MPTPNFTPAPHLALGPDGLTDKQRRLVRFILRTMEAEGRAPTVREMMASMGAASTSVVTKTIQMLFAPVQKKKRKFPTNRRMLTKI